MTDLIKGIKCVKQKGGFNQIVNAKSGALKWF